MLVSRFSAMGFDGTAGRLDRLCDAVRADSRRGRLRALTYLRMLSFVVEVLALSLVSPLLFMMRR